MRHILSLLIIIIALPATLHGEKNDWALHPILRKPIQKIQHHLDSAALKHIDTLYIGINERPWTVEFLTNFHHSSLEMNSVWESYDPETDTEYPLRMSASTHNGFATSVGFRLAYRGTGLGYTKRIWGSGSTFTFGTNAAHYGINFFYNSYGSNKPMITINGNGDKERGHAILDDPIKVKNYYFSAYYVLNGRRYAHSAMSSPSMTQIRSAGSFIAGAMVYHARIRYDSNPNWVMSFMMNDIGRIEFTQVSLGAGYAYNWVPAKGWLIAVIAQPMITVYNRTRFHYYEQTYDESIIPEEGNEEAAIGQKEFAKDKTRNRVTLNFDASLTLVRNWRRIYFRLNGRYNQYKFGAGQNSGRINEWRVNTSLGFRF